jgi:ankyrin repeat protein
LFFFQDGWTPAFLASQNGRAETLALLLENKADANAATKVLKSEHSHI